MAYQKQLKDDLRDVEKSGRYIQKYDIDADGKEISLGALWAAMQQTDPEAQRAIDIINCDTVSHWTGEGNDVAGWFGSLADLFNPVEDLALFGEVSSALTNVAGEFADVGASNAFGPGGLIDPTQLVPEHRRKEETECWNETFSSEYRRDMHERVDRQVSGSAQPYLDSYMQLR